MRSRSARRAALAGLGALVLALAGCKSKLDYAREFQDRNPHAALEYVALALQEDKSDPEAFKVADTLGKSIASLNAKKVDEFGKAKKYIEAVAEADRTMATQDLLRGATGGKVQISVESDQREKFAKLAAEQLYERGASYEQQSAFKDAAKAYRRTLGFVPGFKDAKAKYDATLAQAKQKMLVGRFGTAQGFENLAGKLQQDLSAKITELNPEFVELVRRPPATLRLDGNVEVAVGDTGWKQTRHRNIYKHRFQSGTDPQGNAIYTEEDVVAEWTINRRARSIKLTLSYTIFGKGSTVVDGGKAQLTASDEKAFASDFGGHTNHAEYNNAIPSEVRDMPKQRVEVATHQQMAEQLSSGWANPDQPVHKFAHKIYAKFK